MQTTKNCLFSFSVMVCECECDVTWDDLIANATVSTLWSDLPSLSMQRSVCAFCLTSQHSIKPAFKWEHTERRTCHFCVLACNFYFYHAFIFVIVHFKNNEKLHLLHACGRFTAHFVKYIVSPQCFIIILRFCCCNLKKCISFPPRRDRVLSLACLMRILNWKKNS